MSVSTDGLEKEVNRSFWSSLVDVRECVVSHVMADTETKVVDDTCERRTVGWWAMRERRVNRKNISLCGVGFQIPSTRTL